MSRQRTALSPHPPPLGVSTDLRDLGIELFKLWPGGESPNFLAMGSAVFGFGSSFIGPQFDWMATVGKQLAKVLDASKPLWLGLMKVGKSLDVAALNKSKDLLVKMATNPPFAKFADNVLVRAEDDLERLLKVFNGLGDDGIAALKRVADDAGLGPDEAKKLMDKLSNLDGIDLDALKAPGRLDQLFVHVGMVRDALKHANPDIRLEGRVGDHLLGRLERFKVEIPRVPGTGNITEVDAEVEEAIIEIANGSANKLRSLRLKRLPEVNPTNKPVILYAPNYKPSAVGSAEAELFRYARTLEKLDEIILELRTRP